MKANLQIRIELLKNGLFIKDLAAPLGVSPCIVYQHLRKELSAADTNKYLDIISDMSTLTAAVVKDEREVENETNKRTT